MCLAIASYVFCGQFFNSKRELKGHKDRSHRITDAKLMSVIVPEIITTKPAATADKRHYQEENV
jgi:hypothetical protein